MSSLNTIVKNSTHTYTTRRGAAVLMRESLEFLEAIRSVNPPGRWKILVVDEHSQKLLGSVLKQFDILQENVTRMCVGSLH